MTVNPRACSLKNIQNIDKLLIRLIKKKGEMTQIHKNLKLKRKNNCHQGNTKDYKRIL